MTTVASAAQRNQNSAVGAITLPMAGFCSSGIFGIDGICTKLKYHSRPIHITPDSTCSQRMKNAAHAWSNRSAAGEQHDDHEQHDAGGDGASE